MMATVKAKVRAGNRYGTATAGAIVEVDADELARVPWCLISIEEDEREYAAAYRDVEAEQRAKQAEYEQGREMYVAQLRAQREAAARTASAVAEAKATEAEELRQPVAAPAEAPHVDVPHVDVPKAEHHKKKG